MRRNENSDELTLKDIFNQGMNNLEKSKYLQAQSDFKNVLIRGTGTDLLEMMPNIFWVNHITETKNTY